MVRAALQLFQLFSFLMKGSVIFLSLSDILLCSLLPCLALKISGSISASSPVKVTLNLSLVLSVLKITEQLYGSWDLRDSLPNVLFCIFIKKEKGKICFQVNHRQILVKVLNTVKTLLLLFCWLKNHNRDYIYIHHLDSGLSEMTTTSSQPRLYPWIWLSQG